MFIHVQTDASATTTQVYQSSGNPQVDRMAADGAHAWTFSRTASLGAGPFRATGSRTVEVVATRRSCWSWSVRSANVRADLLLIEIPQSAVQLL